MNLVSRMKSARGYVGARKSRDDHGTQMKQWSENLDFLLKVISLVTFFGFAISGLILWRFLAVIGWKSLLLDVVGSPSSIIVFVQLVFLALILLALFFLPSFVVWQMVSGARGISGKFAKLCWWAGGMVLLALTGGYAWLIVAMFSDDVSLEIPRGIFAIFVALIPSLLYVLDVFWWKGRKSAVVVRFFWGIVSLVVLLSFPYGVMDKLIQATMKEFGVFDERQHSYALVRKESVNAFLGFNAMSSAERGGGYRFSAYKWFGFGSVLLLCKEKPEFSGRHDLQVPQACVVGRPDDVRLIARELKSAKDN